ncbi:MAG TPA: CPBP family intramembrane metalloprotease [Candidatus Levilactobacillus faecigallinarum]|uniref:CPBP family intramembrane metalloprotease n=1 Tax=Candidatus Levilactobacillus faecigallinarum TaxID=2838638 RepID=A0A9D1QTM0_9LACO|nr:CPBP family intramembrane metalloprotease [Candidatus Levilactobacillus faecigallinarum]
MAKRRYGQILGVWLGSLLAIYLMGSVSARFHLPELTRELLIEVFMVIFIVGVNRYGVHGHLYWRPDVSVREQLRVNTFPLFIIGLGLLTSWVAPWSARTGYAIGLAALAGLVAVFEETLFRGIILGSLLTGLSQQRHGVLWAVGLSSLLFSLSHAINLTHQSAAVTAVQVLGTFAMGLLLAVSYLQTRSLIWPMAFHALFDFSGFLRLGLTTGANPQTPLAVELVSVGVAGCWALCLLRPNQQRRVLARFMTEKNTQTTGKGV